MSTDEGLYRFYVYLYSDHDGTPVYVGKGQGDRYKHFGEEKRDSLLRRKLLSIGLERVVVTFLKLDLTEEESLSWEKYYIKLYGRLDMKTGTLCNHTDGGEGFIGSNLELRKQISEKLKGHTVSPETRQKIRDSVVKTQSDPEVRKRMSDAHLGKTPSDHCKRVNSARMKGNTYALGKPRSQEVRDSISRNLKETLRKRREQRLLESTALQGVQLS